MRTKSIVLGYLLKVLCVICLIESAQAADLDLSVRALPQTSNTEVHVIDNRNNVATALGLIGRDSWNLASMLNGADLSLTIGRNSLSKQGTFGMMFHVDNAIQQYLLPAGMGASVAPSTSNIILYSPSQWNASFLAIQLKDGSVLAIWAKDGGFLYKKLTLLGGGDFSIEVFRDSTKSIKSEWTIRSYPTWQSAAKAFRAEVLSTKSPTSGIRTRDIASVINLQVAQDGVAVLDTIQRIAQTNDPHTTLLYIPLWRLHDYDEGYPNYTPKTYIKDAITLAHQLGFRVMVHFNNDFVSMSASEKDVFWNNRFLRWSAAGCVDPILYHLAQFPARDSFRVDRGDPNWQAYIVSSIVNSQQALGFDGVHLDVSSSLPVGCNNSMQLGTETILKSLRNKLPNILISGEYMTEASFTETDIYQALPVEIAGWPETLLNKSSFHPIGLAIFTPAKAYGHLRGGGVDPNGTIVANVRANVETNFHSKTQSLMLPTSWVTAKRTQ